MQMEFWGVECKSGSSVKVDPGSDMIVHISQAALGESKKKGNEPIYLYLVVDHITYTIGMLSQVKFPQLSTEILLQKGFELSHSWKHGSVYFTGYKVDAHDDDVEDSSDDEKEESKPNTEEVKSAVKKTDVTKSGTKQVNFKVPNEDAKVKQDEDDSDEDSEDMSSSEDLSDDEDKKVSAGGDNDEDSDDDDDDDDDDDEDDETSEDEDETPKKPEQSKKRPAEAEAPKTPTSEKKGKFVTPQKTETKKPHVHVATPHPAKQMGKKGGMGETSKSGGGTYSCKSCNRSFTSEVGLQSHTKAKHSAAA